MGRIWAMGVSASNCAADLSAAAKIQADARQKLIEELGVGDHLAGARRRLDLIKATDVGQHGERQVNAPAIHRGETYQIEEMTQSASGDRTVTLVRPIGGGRFERQRVRELVDGGEHTRVRA